MPTVSSPRSSAVLLEVLEFSGEAWDTPGGFLHPGDSYTDSIFQVIDKDVADFV